MNWPRLRELDLSLGLRHGRRSLALAAIVGGGWGLAMALADAGPFHSVVPTVQLVLVNEVALGPRLLLAWRGALVDEVLLRLVGMTGLVWLGIALVGQRRWVWPLAIGFAAFVLWPLLARLYLLDQAWTVLVLGREVLLHGGAGVLWGWLYWRHGWFAGLAGHCAAHLVLQPALGMVL